MTLRICGVPGACLLMMGLGLALAGCQSASLPIFGKDEKATVADAGTQNADQTTAAQESAGNETTATAGDSSTTPLPASPPQPTAVAQADAGQVDNTDAQSVAAQGSLAAAAAANNESDGGVQRIDTKGGIGASLSRRLNKMLGTSSSATPSAGPQVVDTDVAGVWTLDEEDGLRVCTVTMSGDETKQVLRGPNCSGFVEGVASWGLFGPELQLRDTANTVLARLRQSGEGWVGFTVETGVPLVLSRG